VATIGIDVTALSTRASGGIGTSQYETMRAMERAGSPHRFIMYATSQPVVPFTDRPLDLGWQLRLGSGLTTRSNILWMQTGVNRMLAEDGVELFWSPRHLLPLRARGMATVATIQDFWHHYFPEQQPWLNRTLNKALIGRILSVADRIVTHSESTARDAERFGDVPGERIDVIPLGVDTEVFRPAGMAQTEEALARLGVTRPFLLCLDVHNPRKNFAAAIAALAALPGEIRERVQLVGLGSPRATAEQARPERMARERGVESQLRLLGDVAFGDLIALYSGAEALVYPSVYEGFGMPILEAMACGCPVVTSDRSSIPEVAGDAALVVGLHEPARLADAVRQVLTDASLRERLARDGAERVRSFTWERTGERMLETLDRVLVEHRGGR
jgi:glycosyltransferase involved in cell wall biosynthesis